jgi:dolichyl-phosphate-mannose--protein O-mannosyl transferase
MLALHADLKNHGNVYVSPPWSWLLDKRPMLWFFGDDGSSYREVADLGNPLAWWLGLALLVVAAVLAWHGRRTLLTPGPAMAGGLAVVATLATYLPWFVLAISRTYTFIGYVLPVLPFLYLGVASVVAAAARSVTGRVVTAVAMAAVVGLSAFLYPVSTGYPLSPSAWHARMLFRWCDPLPDSVDRSKPLTPAARVGTPPTWWCWI